MRKQLPEPMRERRREEEPAGGPCREALGKREVRERMWESMRKLSQLMELRKIYKVLREC